ncbi:MAG: hypothetical protein ACTSRG_07840 [Candidatus Helarchaeota archaeon]
MSRDLIKTYKILIDHIFLRSKGVLGDKFINKLIKKAEKVTENGGKSLLRGIEYNQNELKLELVLKNYGENESAYSEEVISSSFNKILELIDKALTMLIGKESSLKIFKDGLQDLKVNDNQTCYVADFEKNLPKFIR